MILAASTAPSALPAPTTVWSSSKKRMIFPALFTSSSTLRMRSSNSPRYLVPATIPAISRDSTRVSNSSSGTSPEMIRRASPSARAVFPTPGSPNRQGLFLVRRERIWIMRLISSSRPMTGSSRSIRASAVRSRLHSRRVLLHPSSRGTGRSRRAERRGFSLCFCIRSV